MAIMALRQSVNEYIISIRELLVLLDHTGPSRGLKGCADDCREARSQAETIRGSCNGTPSGAAAR